MVTELQGVQLVRHCVESNLALFIFFGKAIQMIDFTVQRRGGGEDEHRDKRFFMKPLDRMVDDLLQRLGLQFFLRIETSIKTECCTHLSGHEGVVNVHHSVFGRSSLHPLVVDLSDLCNAVFHTSIDFSPSKADHRITGTCQISLPNGVALQLLFRGVMGVPIHSMISLASFKMKSTLNR